jgi:hypothetical protein
MELESGLPSIIVSLRHGALLPCYVLRKKVDRFSLSMLDLYSSSTPHGFGGQRRPFGPTIAANCSVSAFICLNTQVLQMNHQLLTRYLFSRAHCSNLQDNFPFCNLVALWKVKLGFIPTDASCCNGVVVIKTTKTRKEKHSHSLLLLLF